MDITTVQDVLGWTSLPPISHSLPLMMGAAYYRVGVGRVSLQLLHERGE